MCRVAAQIYDAHLVNADRHSGIGNHPIHQLLQLVVVQLEKSCMGRPVADAYAAHSIEGSYDNWPSHSPR